MIDIITPEGEYIGALGYVPPPYTGFVIHVRDGVDIDTPVQTFNYPRTIRTILQRAHCSVLRSEREAIVCPDEEHLKMLTRAGHLHFGTDPFILDMQDWREYVNTRVHRRIPHDDH